MKRVITYIVSHLRIFHMISVMAVTVALILIMFPDNYTREQFDYSVGTFWRDDDLYAPYDFTILKSVSETSDEIRRIKEESTLYFNFDSTAHSTAMHRLSAQNLPRRQSNLARQVLSVVYHSDGYCGKSGS